MAKLTRVTPAVTEHISDTIVQPTFTLPPEGAFENLRSAIRSFETSLEADRTIGIITGAASKPFYVRSVSHKGETFVFTGTYDSNPAQLVQHYTQLSVLLTALPKLPDSPPKIGFV